MPLGTGPCQAGERIPRSPEKFKPGGLRPLPGARALNDGHRGQMLP